MAFVKQLITENHKLKDELKETYTIIKKLKEQNNFQAEALKIATNREAYNLRLRESEQATENYKQLQIIHAGKIKESEQATKIYKQLQIIHTGKIRELEQATEIYKKLQIIHAGKIRESKQATEIHKQLQIIHAGKIREIERKAMSILNHSSKRGFYNIQAKICMIIENHPEKPKNLPAALKPRCGSLCH